MPSRLVRRWAYACRMWRIPKIVIHAPDYTHLSSGVRCLHLLCDRLNDLGVSAAVTARVIDPRLNTPRIRAKTISADPALLDRSIVIYPEVVAGNPLGARHVVRYLLNKPGFFTGTGVDSYGDGDYCLHFADEFRPSNLVSRRLRLPLVDTTVFMPPQPSMKRNGFLVYGARHQLDVKTFPSWIDNLTMISRAAPRDPPALASLYQSSRALIVGERTSATAEALHCHCPVILLPHHGFAIDLAVSSVGGYGVTVGFDLAGLAHATSSAPAFPAHYATRCGDVDANVLDFVADAARYFGLADLQKIAA
jgi:O-antigen biosynthesis protein